MRLIFVLAALAALPVGAQPLAYSFATFAGGTGDDQTRDVAIGADGSIYVTGGAEAGFETTSGAYDESHNGSFDVVVQRYFSDGTLDWSTVLGGSNYERAYAIEVDSTGVYAAGRAGTGFPTTSGVIQEAFAGDNDVNPAYGANDGFVAKLSLDGASLLWATYVGGAWRDFVRDMAIDSSGNVYAALSEVGADWGYSNGGYDTTRSALDVGIIKLNSTATTVTWWTYLGGDADDGYNPSIRVDGSDQVHVVFGANCPNTGAPVDAFDTSCGGSSDALVAKLAADGGSLAWGSYVGGNGIDFSETHALALSPAGLVYVSGATTSTDLPCSAGYQTSYQGTGGAGTGQGTNYPGDGFIYRFSADGASAICTYLGGSVGEGNEGVGLDAHDNVIVSGATFSSDFPVTDNAIQGSLAGDADAYVVRLTADLDGLQYGTYLGGAADDDFGRTVMTTPGGQVVAAGMTWSSNWPTSSANQGSLGGGVDGWVLLLSPAPTGRSVSGGSIQ